MNLKHKLTSVFLAMLMLLYALPLTSLASDEPVAEPAQELSDIVLGSDNADGETIKFPDIVDSVETKENNYVQRVKAEEKDLYTFVFANGDGTNTMRVFSHPVKYIADDGSVRDISLDIEAKRGGGFVSADHGVVTTFESKLTDGISLEYNDVSVKLVPKLSLGTVPQAKLSTNGKSVSYAMNDITSFVYELTYAGFKEDIVVEEYTGQTEYEFTLFTNGLILCEEYGSFYLTDEKGNVEATIGDIFVFTADERNNTMGSMSYETVRANQEYVLTIHLDAEYLADEETTYPIRIDPTIEINYDSNGSGAIQDVTINQSSTFSGTHTSLFVGRHLSGSLSRALMRFPNLTLGGISADQITAASVEIRDMMCQSDEDITVQCHIYNNSAPAWSESSTTTWASVGNSYLGTLLDSHLISYGQGNVGNHRYSFDILTAAKAWANGTQSPAKGLVFKANSTFENQTSSNIKTWYKSFASYNRSDHRPSLSITYYRTISLNAENASIVEGGTLTLVATTNPSGQSVTWHTSNSNIATVSQSGVITAHKAGNVSIAAAIVDDNGVLKYAYCNIYVYIPNGVYYIQNCSSNYYLHVQDGKIKNMTNVKQDSMYPPNAGTAYCVRQMWKTYYLGEGRYSVRPMHKLNMALDVTGNNVDVYNIGTTDTLSSVPDYAKWTIEWNSTGYVFKRNGTSNYTLQIEDGSTAAGANAIATTYSSMQVHNRWNLLKLSSPPIGLLLYDTLTGEHVAFPTKYVAPNESINLSNLKLEAAFFSESSINQDVYWESTNSNIAKVDNTSGEITGISPGSVSISAYKYYAGIKYSISYKVIVTEIPSGTYSIQNTGSERFIDIEGPTMANGTIIHQFEYHGEISQRWIFTHLGDGTYSIKSALNPSYFLGVINDSTADGAAVVLRTGSITDGMKWSITKMDSLAYKITPKTGQSSNRVLALEDSNLSGNGVDVKQRTYGVDTGTSYEWRVFQPFVIGFSTDNYTDGCSHGERQSYRYANKFYDTLADFPGVTLFEKIHHYNKGSNRTASILDFSQNGAISDDIDFMVFIGHGKVAEDIAGNALHYNCNPEGLTHITAHYSSRYNVYTSSVKFGSENSNLRWVWLYTCNFLTNSTYVSDDNLKDMMNGAHILLGTASLVTLCDAMVETFGNYLQQGIPIIDSYFLAGHEGEATVIGDLQHYQKVLFVPQARYETIYSPRIDFEYESSDIQIISREVHSDYVY